MLVETQKKKKGEKKIDAHGVLPFLTRFSSLLIIKACFL